jgi:hypothetical protein
VGAHAKPILQYLHFSDTGVGTWVGTGVVPPVLLSTSTAAGSDTGVGTGADDSVRSGPISMGRDGSYVGDHFRDKKKYVN